MRGQRYVWKQIKRRGDNGCGTYGLRRRIRIYIYFLNGLAYAHRRADEISMLEEEVKQKNTIEIIEFIVEFYKRLYMEEDQDCPTLDNLYFTMIKEKRVDWLEKF